MRIEQARKTVNQLNKDISFFKEMVILVKKEADKSKKIATTQRNITKNISSSMLRQKTVR